jgi:hypothetical protein
VSSRLLKTTLPLMLIVFFSYPSYAEEAGKPLVEKLQDTNIVITVSIEGCDEEVKTHCDGLGDNTDKVFMCLAAYEDYLSAACREGILEAALSIKMGAAALDYSVRACEADADKYCLDVQPGNGRLVGCIRANESSVSKECVAALKKTGLWDQGRQPE